MKTVGVLALQGDFEAHKKAVEWAGGRAAFQAIEVRSQAELDQCDGLIIPGGESTTMLKLLERENLTAALRSFAEAKPVFGSCAGAILLAREVTHPAQPSLGLIDISVERNAYGRQVDSCVAHITTTGGEEMEAVFIRAPIIRGVGADARVLARYHQDPVWVEQGLHTVTTFHPELTADLRVHRRFIEKL